MYHLLETLLANTTTLVMVIVFGFVLLTLTTYRHFKINTNLISHSVLYGHSAMILELYNFFVNYSSVSTILMT